MNKHIMRSIQETKTFINTGKNNTKFLPYPLYSIDEVKRYMRKYGFNSYQLSVNSWILWNE